MTLLGAKMGSEVGTEDWRIIHTGEKAPSWLSLRWEKAALWVEMAAIWVEKMLLKEDMCLQTAEYPPQKYPGNLELSIKHVFSSTYLISTTCIVQLQLCSTDPTEKSTKGPACPPPSWRVYGTEKDKKLGWGAWLFVLLALILSLPHHCEHFVAQSMFMTFGFHPSLHWQSRGHWLREQALNEAELVLILCCCIHQDSYGFEW